MKFVFESTISPIVAASAAAGVGVHGCVSPHQLRDAGCKLVGGRERSVEFSFAHIRLGLDGKRYEYALAQYIRVEVSMQANNLI